MAQKRTERVSCGGSRRPIDIQFTVLSQRYRVFAEKYPTRRQAGAAPWESFGVAAAAKERPDENRVGGARLVRALSWRAR